jgi:hypothetical protein
MALNFGILQPANISGQFMAGQQEAQQNKLASQQLETSSIQLENLKRDRDALAKLQQQFVANGKSPDLEENFGAMIQSGIPHFVDIGTQGLQKIQQQKQFANIMGGNNAAPTAAPASPAAPMPAGTLGSGTYDPAAPVAQVNALARPSAAPATPVNALAAPQAAGNPFGGNVDMLRQKRDALLSMGTPQSIAAAKALDSDIAIASKEPVYHNVPGVGLVDPRTGTVITPSKERQDTDLIRNFNAAKAQGFKGDIFDYERKLKEAGRPPATPPQPSAPVAVVDPVTGKQVLVSREEAIKNRMTPAVAMESLAPKEIQKREAALPEATSAIKGFEAKADNFVADLQKLKDHPGLSEITGLIGGRTPALTDAGRAAQALYDKVAAKGGFQALQDLRSASKTGGALGNVSNQEGKQLASSFAAIDRKQNAEDLKAALETAIADVQGSKTRMREAYDSTYSYKSERALSSPSPAPKPAQPSNRPTIAPPPGFTPD